MLKFLSVVPYQSAWFALLVTAQSALANLQEPTSCEYHFADFGPMLDLSTTRSQQLNLSETKGLFDSVLPRLVDDIRRIRDEKIASILTSQFTTVDDLYNHMQARGDAAELLRHDGELESLLRAGFKLELMQLSQVTAPTDQQRSRITRLRLILSHPRLIALLVKSIESNVSVDVRFDYRKYVDDFLWNVHDAVLGHSATIFNDLRESSQIKLASLWSKQQGDSDLDSRVAKSVFKAALSIGQVGFPIRDNDTRFLVAMNGRTKLHISNDLQDQVNVADVIPVNETHTNLKFLAQVLDYRLNRSDRWDVPADAWPHISVADQGKLAPGQGVTLRFYDLHAALNWKVPPGVKLSSRLGSVVSVFVETLDGVVQLDNDPRIQSFAVR